MGRTETVTVEGLAFEGDGITHLESGKAAFVPASCPGDTLAIEIDEERDSFVRAHIAAVIEPSPCRITPNCLYAEQCGGCSWQHISPETQLAWKRRFVADALERIGLLKLDTDIVRPCISSGAFNTRNKIELQVTTGHDGLRVGMHEAGGDRLIEIDSCPLLHKKAAKLPKALRGALRYLDKEGALGIRRLGIRHSNNTGDLEIALWTEPGAFPRKTVAKVLKEATGARSITRVMVKGDTKARKVVGVEALSGAGCWNERLCGESLLLSAPSFFQVNTHGAEILVETALSFLDLAGDEYVADLYAGAGTFTLPLARICDEVAAVEMEGSSIRDLRRNLERAELDADVIGGDAARELPGLGQLDAAIIDPPRSGLSDRARGALLTNPPERLVYVSCNPATLARDLRELVSSDGLYRIEQVQPVDLFPQSFHVETVVLMTRK